MRFFILFLRQKAGSMLFLLICFLTLLVSFALYHLPLAAVIYPAALCAGFALIRFFSGYASAVKKHRDFQSLNEDHVDYSVALSKYSGIPDSDYLTVIEKLSNREKKRKRTIDQKEADMMDYYTVWTHQIKTPIASMRLTLQNEDSPLSRSASDELMKIEQYVDMALCYLRLDSDSTDYVFREHDIDAIIKGSIRKFAGQFISCGISLNYEPIGIKAVTDEKWFAFVIEQVISNSLKYTPSGSISVYAEDGHTVCIKDTGIGISPEDLPRVFEKGYTGYNGRRDKRASGLGLYLCKRICKNLGCEITAESPQSGGTLIRISLNKSRTQGD